MSLKKTVVRDHCLQIDELELKHQNLRALFKKIVYRFYTLHNIISFKFLTNLIVLKKVKEKYLYII